MTLCHSSYPRVLLVTLWHIQVTLVCYLWRCVTLVTLVCYLWRCDTFKLYSHATSDVATHSSHPRMTCDALWCWDKLKLPSHVICDAMLHGNPLKLPSHMNCDAMWRCDTLKLLSHVACDTVTLKLLSYVTCDIVTQAIWRCYTFQLPSHVACDAVTHEIWRCDIDSYHPMWLVTLHTCASSIRFSKVTAKTWYN